MTFGPEFGGDVGRNAGRPVQPGVAFTPRKIEDHCGGSSAFGDSRTMIYAVTVEGRSAHIKNA